MQTIEIPISKRKLVFSFIGCLAFVGAGLLFIFKPESFAGKTVFRTGSMITVVGVLSILFFGFCGYFIAKKLAAKTPGLSIDDRGVSDNSSGIADYTILWKDITEVGTMRIFRQSFVTLKVSNPEEYINAETRPAIKKGLQLNLRTAGTPFCISANALDIKFKKLLTLLQEKHREHKPADQLS